MIAELGKVIDLRIYTEGGAGNILSKVVHGV